MLLQKPLFVCFNSKEITQFSEAFELKQRLVQKLQCKLFRTQKHGRSSGYKGKGGYKVLGTRQLLKKQGHHIY